MCVGSWARKEATIFLHLKLRHFILNRSVKMKNGRKIKGRKEERKTQRKEGRKEGMCAILRLQHGQGNVVSGKAV